jgi:hypothetical protein
MGALDFVLVADQVCGTVMRCFPMLFFDGLDECFGLVLGMDAFKAADEA